MSFPTVFRGSSKLASVFLTLLVCYDNDSKEIFSSVLPMPTLKTQNRVRTLLWTIGHCELNSCSFFTKKESTPSWLYSSSITLDLRDWVHHNTCPLLFKRFLEQLRKYRRNLEPPCTMKFLVCMQVWYCYIWSLQALLVATWRNRAKFEFPIQM